MGKVLSVNVKQSADKLMSGRPDEFNTSAFDPQNENKQL